jgi:hypothetical protein
MKVRAKLMKTNKLPPLHPGEILREEFMKRRGLSQNDGGFRKKVFNFCGSGGSRSFCR